MKKISLCIVCIFISVHYLYAQTNGDYRSQQTVSKNWYDAENWQIFENGNWHTATEAPCLEEIPQCITISKHDTIIMDTNNYTINKLIIEDSAHLTFPYGNVECEDSIIVCGTLYN